MKRGLLLALALIACSKKSGPLPVIESFTVDDANPEQGAPVQFSYSVSGATGGVALYPVPGAVYQSPVTVIPPTTATFSLQATNENGVSSRDIAVNVRPVPPLAINATDAAPGQVAPGGAVTLSWTTTSADHATVTDGATGQSVDVPITGSAVVYPGATTAYTLTAYNKPGRIPASLSARITARVSAPPSVSGFSASPASIAQGQFSTLSWSGNAASYWVTDGMTTFNVGPRRSLVVRPSADTTYALHAKGLGGELPSPLTATVMVVPRPATTLVYYVPGPGVLQLVFDSCNTPCTLVTLKIVTTTAVQLRGVALDLPLDTTKVSFDASTFSTPLAGAVAKAARGSGSLQDTLALGIALKGTGTAPAQDVTLSSGDELARFTLALLPAGGSGTVFNGAMLAASPTSPYKALIQSASGRAANAIAVGTLEAQ